MDIEDALKDLDLSQYIAADKLSAMSDLERKCCANRIRNYEVMKAIGKVLHDCNIFMIVIFMCILLTFFCMFFVRISVFHCQYVGNINRWQPSCRPAL